MSHAVRRAYEMIYWVTLTQRGGAGTDGMNLLSVSCLSDTTKPHGGMICASPGGECLSGDHRCLFSLLHQTCTEFFVLIRHGFHEGPARWTEVA